MTFFTLTAITPLQINYGVFILSWNVEVSQEVFPYEMVTNINAYSPLYQENSPSQDFDYVC